VGASDFAAAALRRRCSGALYSGALGTVDMIRSFVSECVGWSVSVGQPARGQGLGHVPRKKINVVGRVRPPETKGGGAHFWNGSTGGAARSGVQTPRGSICS